MICYYKIIIIIYCCKFEYGFIVTMSMNTNQVFYANMTEKTHERNDLDIESQYIFVIPVKYVMCIIWFVECCAIIFMLVLIALQF
jgi:hypothetical protein